MAILANFDKDSEAVALQNILNGVQSKAKGNFAENRYFEQLRVLAHLRDLDIKLVEAMESITQFFKVEKDPFYIKGKAIGEAEGKTIGKAEGNSEKAISIAIEMKKESIPANQIAKFTGLTIEEIEKL